MLPPEQELKVITRTLIKILLVLASRQGNFMANLNFSTVLSMNLFFNVYINVVNNCLRPLNPSHDDRMLL